MEKIVSFAQAVACMQQGGIVAYPTETFYAVGCTLMRADALHNLYGAKKRPAHRPLPVLAATWEHVQAVAFVSAAEKALAEAFWPGPLTILLRARATVPERITAGTGRIAVRISTHTAACALAVAVDGVIVCSSANISGEAPVVRPEALSPTLVQALDGIYCADPLPAGIAPSTLVSVEDATTLCMRREGAVPVTALQAKGWNIQ